MEPNPSAGWFPDPWGVAEMRYWDGARWTADVHPPVEPPAAEPAASPVAAEPSASVDAELHRQLATIVLVALALVAIVVGVVLLADPFSSSSTSSTPEPTPAVAANTGADSPAVEHAERQLSRLKSRLGTKAEAERETEESKAKEGAKLVAIAMEAFEARHEEFPESPGELRELGVHLPPELEAFGVGVSGYIVRVRTKGGGWYSVEGGERGEGNTFSCSPPGEGECPASGRWQ
jgi:hypothetical protein